MQTKRLPKLRCRNHTVLLICINTKSTVPPCWTQKQVGLAEAGHFGAKINDRLCSCLIRLEVLCPGCGEELSCQLIPIWYWLESDAEERNEECTEMCFHLFAERILFVWGISTFTHQQTSKTWKAEVGNLWTLFKACSMDSSREGGCKAGDGGHPSLAGTV